MPTMVPRTTLPSATLPAAQRQLRRRSHPAEEVYAVFLLRLRHLAAISGVLQIAPEDLDRRVRSVADAAQARHGFADTYTYVAQVGRATLIEIHFVTPPDWPVAGIGTLDAIRQRVSDDLGGEGPNRWLTISFTEDPEWAF